MTRSTPPPGSRPTGRRSSTPSPARVPGRSAGTISTADHPGAQRPGSPDGLLGRSDVRALAAALGLHPTRRRGQNFVVDANTIRRIVSLAELDPRDVVVEVGPGLGSLTVGLVAAARQVVAVEIDRRLAEALPATLAARRPDLADRLTVVTADALRVTDLPGPAPTALVANLPYNVAVPVLLHLLDGFPSLQRALILVQAEVADRLTAAPGSPAYGVPTLKLGWYAEARRVGRVPPTVFWPRPRVESGLVAVRRRDPPGPQTMRHAVFAVVEAAFAQRRKTLRAALADWAGTPDAAASALAAAGIAPGARGEELGLAAYLRLVAARPPRP